MENIERFGYCGIDCDACNKYSKEIRDCARGKGIDLCWESKAGCENE